MGKYRTDTQKSYRHIPCLDVDDLFKHVPYGSTPVVVELTARSRRIFNYVHPDSAFYIFGPEDGSVNPSIVERVQHVIQIPTKGCMNLAATVNVVLYDRMCKQEKAA